MGSPIHLRAASFRGLMEDPTMSGKDSELNTGFIPLCSLASYTMSPVPPCTSQAAPSTTVKITPSPFKFVSVGCFVTAVRKAIDGGCSSISFFRFELKASPAAKHRGLSQLALCPSFLIQMLLWQRPYSAPLRACQPNVSTLSAYSAPQQYSRTRREGPTSLTGSPLHHQLDMCLPLLLEPAQRFQHGEQGGCLKSDNKVTPTSTFTPLRASVAFSVKQT